MKNGLTLIATIPEIKIRRVITHQSSQLVNEEVVSVPKTAEPERKKISKSNGSRTNKTDLKLVCK